MLPQLEAPRRRADSHGGGEGVSIWREHLNKQASIRILVPSKETPGCSENGRKEGQ